MCARYEIFFNNKIAAQYQKALHSIEIHTIDRERKEAYPSELLPIITKDGLIEASWGIPFGKNRIINARSETVLEKRMFQNAFIESRCIVPITAYYEWNEHKTKFRIKSQAPMSLAGIYRDHTFAILTVDSNPEVKKVHGRMPVILDQEIILQYLLEDPLEVIHYLLPYEGELEIKAVSPEQLSIF